MVSSSRKKNKGKERKAKKIETEREKTHKLWWGMAIGEQQLIGKTITCDHGCGELPNNFDHPVSRFMNDFVSRCNANYLYSKMIEPLFEKHPQVWNDENYKQFAMNILIRIGANNMLIKACANVKGAVDIAKTIVVLEHYDSMRKDDYGIYTAVNCRGAGTKLRDLNSTVSSNRRDVLKFYSKRISCSCLEEMHQEARKILTKMGKCYGCNQEKQRVALSVCSRCMIAQYCSRSCHVAHWPRHKKECDLHVKAHK